MRWWCLPVSRSVSGNFYPSFKKKSKRNSGMSLVVFLGFHVKKERRGARVYLADGSPTTRQYHNKTKPIKPIVQML
ncbi:hypothetical protein Hanom_Chr11g01060951 [Helianthus anomalus]